ncbi:secreted Ly-6/uPAR-related protein 1-like [Discoglossus pictus]
MLMRKRCDLYNSSSEFGHYHNSKMKGFVISLLALALCFQQAWSLQCYECNDPTPSAECSDIVNCTTRQTSCKTVVTSGFVDYPFQGTEMVIRSCSSSCAESNPDQLGEFQLVFCCFNDRCNNRGLFAAGNNSTNSGAADLWKRSYWLPISFIGLAASLLRI